MARILALLLVALPALGAESRWQASAATGMGVLQGNVGWGIGATLLKGGEFQMGLDVSAYRWDYGTRHDPFRSFARPLDRTGATVLSALPTFLWEINELGAPSMTPYLGLAVGPAAYLADGNASGARVHESLVSLMAQLRPGLRFDFAPQLQANLEARLALFRGKTLFFSTFGIGWIL